jgi:HK97 gp10 family phage protein
MNITVEITGLKGVEDALAQAGPKLAKRAMRKALKAGADKFVADAKARAPILKTPTKNRRAGDLRDAITSVIKLSPKQESGRARVGPKYTGKGADDPGVYGLFQEFGTKDSPAQPFMRAAFDKEKGQALNAFTEVMVGEVQKLNK